MNPFDVFKVTDQVNSAIVTVDGGEPVYYPHGENGKPLANEYQAAWYRFSRPPYVFVDPRDPKFVVDYPVKGTNGIWYRFDAGGQLVLWSGGDPETYIKENPLPDRSRPTPEQVARLYAAAFPEDVAEKSNALLEDFITQGAIATVMLLLADKKRAKTMLPRIKQIRDACNVILGSRGR